MKEKLKIHELMDKVLADLRQQKYADYTIGRYRHCYNGLVKFIEGKNVAYYSNALALDYIRHKFGITIDGLYDRCPSNARSSIRALKLLSDYTAHGVQIKKRKFGGKPFECPNEFSADYEAFKLACKSRNYAPMGEASLFWSLHQFLKFMKKEGLASSSGMTSIHILKFLSSQKDYSSRHIAATISRLRNYLRFLYQGGIIEHDLCKCLPHMKITRNPFIPSVWEQTDVKKLLESIDRQNPKGKRDYAILLLVARLGLRVGDIRALKLSDLNWNRKLISIVMQKTKQQLELPLLEDVGWAIIDYLKNGRPKTDSDFVFIRHKAPYDCFIASLVISSMPFFGLLIAFISYASASICTNIIFLRLRYLIKLLKHASLWLQVELLLWRLSFSHIIQSCIYEREKQPDDRLLGLTDFSYSRNRTYKVNASR